MRLEKLVCLRQAEGFMPECHQNPNGKGWLLKELHCSIRPIAEEHPFICDQELETIRQTFPDCQVDRVQWLLEDGQACGFSIQESFKDD